MAHIYGIITIESVNPAVTGYNGKRKEKINFDTSLWYCSVTFLMRTVIHHQDLFVSLFFFFSFSQPSRELAQQVCTLVALNETGIELFLLTIFPLPVILILLPLP